MVTKDTFPRGSVSFFRDGAFGMRSALWPAKQMPMGAPHAKSPVPKKGENMYNYKIIEDKLFYTMPKEIDQHVATGICQEMDMLIDAGGIRHVIMDFGATTFMDSSGVGIIIGRNRKLKLYNGTISVENLSERMKRIFRVTNLYSLVEEVK